jgi:mono/diheme cytochrome c family protein
LIRTFRLSPAAIAALGAALLWIDAAPGATEIKPDVLYHNYCSVCHGDRGDGQSRARNSLVPPPRDFTAPSARAQLTRDYMIGVIRDGKRGTAMVGWRTQLNDNEIAALTDYVRVTFMQPGGPREPKLAPGSISGTHAHGGGDKVHKPSGAQQGSPGARADMSLPFPRQLTGDARRGSQTYYANCVACHGNKGDGQGTRTSSLNPGRRSFSDPASRETLNRPALFAAISAGRKGTQMPAWSTVLNDQQIADVAEFVFGRFLHPAGGDVASAKR